MADVYSVPVKWVPDYWYPNNYKTILSAGSSFILNYYNSIKITVINVTGGILVSALSGYAFARLRFKGKNVIFLLYLATMMVPTQVTIIPKFVLFNTLGLLNTHLSIIIPGLLNISSTFMMRQAYLGVPAALSESAKIDGAGELRVWWQIITPLIKPTIAALVILMFLSNWNSYEEPMIFLSSPKLFTIPIGLNSFRDENVSRDNLIMAATVSSVLPIFIIFLIGQKQFTKGLIVGAIKG